MIYLIGSQLGGDRRQELARPRYARIDNAVRSGVVLGGHGEARMSQGAGHRFTCRTLLNSQGRMEAPQTVRADFGNSRLLAILLHLAPPVLPRVRPPCTEEKIGCRFVLYQRAPCTGGLAAQKRTRALFGETHTYAFCPRRSRAHGPQRTRSTPLHAFSVAEPWRVCVELSICRFVNYADDLEI